MSDDEIGDAPVKLKLPGASCRGKVPLKVSYLKEKMLHRLLTITLGMYLIMNFTLFSTAG